MSTITMNELLNVAKNRYQDANKKKRALEQAKIDDVNRLFQDIPDWFQRNNLDTRIKTLILAYQYLYRLGLLNNHKKDLEFKLPDMTVDMAYPDDGVIVTPLGDCRLKELNFYGNEVEYKDGCNEEELNIPDLRKKHVNAYQAACYEGLVLDIIDEFICSFDEVEDHYRLLLEQLLNVA